MQTGIAWPNYTGGLKQAAMVLSVAHSGRMNTSVRRYAARESSHGAPQRRTEFAQVLHEETLQVLLEGVLELWEDAQRLVVLHARQRGLYLL